MNLRCALAAGAVLVASLAFAPPAEARQASCWGGPTVTDYKGRTFSTSTCPTWIQTAVLDQAALPGAETTGVLFPGDNWMVCQRRSGENPEYGGGRNNYWLYTQGDTSRLHGGWGWIPATAVSYGGDYQAIPGVKLCPAGFYG
ncbi:hypothetical protein ACNF49_24715 [Actinomadura sp. ATCC 39365]